VAELCEIEIATNCTLPGFEDEACEIEFPAVEPCMQRPFIMGMLTRGGFCNQSSNIQPEKFFCEDYQVNGREAPLERSGDQVYLVVYPTKDEELIYFQGFTNEGDIFYMDGREEGKIESDTNITMYADDNLVPENILQQVQFHSSCSQNLRLKDTFGSFQLSSG